MALRSEGGDRMRGSDWKIAGAVAGYGPGEGGWRASMMRIFGLLVGCAIAACLVVNSNIAKADPKPSSFPLWKLVPSKSFAVLGGGVLKSRQWAAYVYPGAGQKGGSHPCLMVADAYRSPAKGAGTLVDSAFDCGVPAPPSSRPVEASLGLSIKKSTKGNLISTTTIAMLLDSSVHEVKLDLDPGQPRTLMTRRLSRSQARKAHVRPLSYVVLSLAKKVCVASVIGYDEAGSSVVETPHRDCE